jgi:hypothetical protein
MAITTTGSTVKGLVKGLPSQCYVSGANNIVPSLYVVAGTPDGVVTSSRAGDVAYNIDTGSFFGAKTTGGSTWFNIGSRGA